MFRFRLKKRAWNRCTSWINHVYKALSSRLSFIFRTSDICCFLTPNSRARFATFSLFSNREITVYHLSIKRMYSCCCKLSGRSVRLHINPSADPHAITTDQPWHSIRVHISIILWRAWSNNRGNTVYFLGHKYVLGPSQGYFNTRPTARAKMSRNRAQNIFMPKNINSIVFLESE